MSVRTKLILMRVGCLMLLGAASVAYPAGSYLLFFFGACRVHRAICDCSRFRQPTR